MHGTAVIPNNRVTHRPVVPVLKPFLTDPLAKLVKKRVAFRPFHIDDVVEPVEIEIERLFPCFGMGTDQRMDDVGGFIDLFLAARHRAILCPLRVVAMHGLQSIDTRLDFD